MRELARPTLDRSRKQVTPTVELRSTVAAPDGTRIAFTRAGEGPPLVLVDGAFCYRGMGPGSPLAALLARSYTVFSYDRRGRAESGDQPHYAVERELGDLDAVIDEAGGAGLAEAAERGAHSALRHDEINLPAKDDLGSG